MLLPQIAHSSFAFSVLATESKTESPEWGEKCADMNRPPYLLSLTRRSKCNTKRVKFKLLQEMSHMLYNQVSVGEAEPTCRQHVKANTAALCWTWKIRRQNLGKYKLRVVRTRHHVWRTARKGSSASGANSLNKPDTKTHSLTPSEPSSPRCSRKQLNWTCWKQKPSSCT